MPGYLKNMLESVEVTVAHKEWAAARLKEAEQIDPDVCQVAWEYTPWMDPYGFFPFMRRPDDTKTTRNYFVRRPGSGDAGWVWDGDLPSHVYDRLWARLNAVVEEHGDARSAEHIASDNAKAEEFFALARRQEQAAKKKRSGWFGSGWLKGSDPETRQGANKMKSEETEESMAEMDTAEMKRREDERLKDKERRLPLRWK